MDPKCVFCEIVAGREPAAVVFETADTLAFLDTRPIIEGHTLVIPKLHIRTIYDLAGTGATSLLETTASVARALRLSLNADGMNLLQRNEIAAGQTVFHLHLHLIPRYINDEIVTRHNGFAQLNWRVLRSFQPCELEPIAERIRKTAEGKT